MVLKPLVLQHPWAVLMLLPLPETLCPQFSAWQSHLHFLRIISSVHSLEQLPQVWLSYPSSVLPQTLPHTPLPFPDYLFMPPFDPELNRSRNQILPNTESSCPPSNGLVTQQVLNKDCWAELNHQAAGSGPLRLP